jgi:SdrD B-like domain
MQIRKSLITLLLIVASASAWARFGGTVFCDANCNGIRDTNEVPLAGITVNAYLCGTSTLVGSTNTAADGTYFFEPSATMPIGSAFYTCVVIPPGYGAGANPGNPGYACTSFCFTFADPCDCTHDIGLCPVTVSCPSPGPGTGTPGYWVNHPEAWPTNQIVIGGITYTKAAAIANMKRSVTKDKRWTIFPALVSAKLNVLIGNDSSCIASTIAAADAWWAAYHASPVAGSSAAWKAGEPLYLMLDAYNNGLLCAPPRD